jgi:LmbE family N-acetylglucosaminyl deacetylase
MTDQFQPFPTDWERATVVVAHPDDIEFGGAGAVAVWTAAGKSVSSVILTRGEAGIAGMPPAEAAGVREAEQRASAAIVGVESVEFLGHRDGRIEYGIPLRMEIAQVIRRQRPELVVGYNHRDVFVNGKWNSPDHRDTGRALLDAIGDAGNEWIFPELEGEPWSGVRYVAIANSPLPTHAVDISDTLDVAVASLEAHSSYLAGLGITDVRTPLTGFAKQTGERFLGGPAIAFELMNR